MNKLLLTILIFFILVAPVFALSPVPLLINYQGKITSPVGAPITGTVDLTFSIHDTDLTGSPFLWSETHTMVPVKAGIFNLLIGAGTVDPAAEDDLSVVLTGEDRWLEIQVDTDPPMTPRQQIVSVAYSIHSSSAANADDVLNKDINPSSVTITGYGEVIDSDGQWIGDPTGLKGPTGSTGATGARGPQGSRGATGPQGSRGASYDESSTIKVCGRESNGLFGDFDIPMSWSTNTCRSSCSFGWQRWSTWTISNGGGVSVIVPWTNC